MRQTELISWNDRRLLNCNEGWRIWRHESCIIVIIIIYYYVLLLLCIIRHFSWQKLRHSLHLSRPLRCPVICAVRGSCHPPYDHMRWSCTQFSLPWNVKWLYGILHTSIFFRALHTHTHGFIYIYKPDTNSNTVLPCARPKHIHITYHSFTILTHTHIYIYIYLYSSFFVQTSQAHVHFFLNLFLWFLKASQRQTSWCKQSSWIRWALSPVLILHYHCSVSLNVCHVSICLDLLHDLTQQQPRKCPRCHRHMPLESLLSQRCNLDQCGSIWCKMQDVAEASPRAEGECRSSAHQDPWKE